MRLTRSTGPNKHSDSDRDARDPFRARALAARSSCAARLSGHEDMHMPSQLHRFDKREAGDHLEARNAATPIASWHADESRRQWPMHHMTNAQPSLMTIHRAPALHHCARDVVTAAPRARSCLRGRTAAPERQAGLSFRPHPTSLGWLQLSGRRGGSARTSGTEKKSLTRSPAASVAERRGPCLHRCRCSRGSVCKVCLFIYSALDRATIYLSAQRHRKSCSRSQTVIG